MAVLGGRYYARDLASATTTFVARTRRFANEIIPGRDFGIEITRVHPKWEAEADTIMKRDGTFVSYLTISDLLLEANMYNLDSEYIWGLVIHELCHASIESKDILAGTFHSHRSKEFKNCVKEHGAMKTFQQHGGHYARFSFRNYYGSKAGMVPPDIFFIWSYDCAWCGKQSYENTIEKYIAKMKVRIIPFDELTPTACWECGGPITNVVHLTPQEVYLYVDDDLIL